ncbi:unnamed protein product, partial [Mesorhabditis spiculigera]
MGNAFYTNKGTAEVCHATLDTCKSMCPSDCMFVDKCNGLTNQYACVIVDSRVLMWLILISFIITVCCCSGLVACYVCKAFRHSFRYSQRTENDIVFNQPGRVHHVQYDVPQRYSHGPKGRH